MIGAINVVGWLLTAENNGDVPLCRLFLGDVFASKNIGNVS